MSKDAPATGPDEEAEAIERIVNVSLALLKSRNSHVPRGQHPKSLGCVRAEFVVEPNLPDSLRAGVFASPRNFPALIRFSNGHAHNDRKGDIHGMALKLMDVDGEKLLEDERQARTQDFLLADSPAFFLKDLDEYVPFSVALERSKESIFGLLGLLGRILFSRRQPWPRLRLAMSKKPDSPLRSWYWSQTPYALDSLEVKYAVRPDLNLSPRPPRSWSRDRLRRALALQLSRCEARFDFLVQTRTTPQQMPINDASVEWAPSLAPFQKVATVRIPPQEFDFPEMWAFEDDLSFTPWHALPAHRPLGAINRARRVVYDVLSARRHESNGRPRLEPDVSDIPSPR